MFVLLQKLLVIVFTLQIIVVTKLPFGKNELESVEAWALKSYLVLPWFMFYQRFRVLSSWMKSFYMHDLPRAMARVWQRVRKLSLATPTKTPVTLGASWDLGCKGEYRFNL